MDCGCALRHTVDRRRRLIGLDATVTPGPGALVELSNSLQIHMDCFLKAETPSSGGDPRMMGYRAKIAPGSSLLTECVEAESKLMLL